MRSGKLSKIVSTWLVLTLVVSLAMMVLPLASPTDAA